MCWITLWQLAARSLQNVFSLCSLLAFHAIDDHSNTYDGELYHYFEEYNWLANSSNENISYLITLYCPPAMTHFINNHSRPKLVTKAGAP